MPVRRLDLVAFILDLARQRAFCIARTDCVAKVFNSSRLPGRNSPTDCLRHTVNPPMMRSARVVREPPGWPRQLSAPTMVALAARLRAIRSIRDLHGARVDRRPPRPSFPSLIVVVGTKPVMVPQVPYDRWLRAGKTLESLVDIRRSHRSRCPDTLDGAGNDSFSGRFQDQGVELTAWPTSPRAPTTSTDFAPTPASRSCSSWNNRTFSMAMTA